MWDTKFRGKERMGHPALVIPRVLSLRCDARVKQATADPSTTLGAKNAPNSAQDDNIVGMTAFFG
jgi:hypothetical protein